MNKQETNPGGVLDPDEVVGRDELVVRLWRILERRSLYLTAERRMGKTSIVRDKMSKQPQPGVRFVYMDVSQAATPSEFVEKLLSECREHLDFDKKAKFFLMSLGKLVSGAELKAGVAVKLPGDLGANWKTLLDSLLRDIAAHPDCIILAFDELPLMLLAIKRGAEAGKGESIVMELLDSLRAARQTESALRMVYTGSLGLHHVLTILKEQGYQNDPTNDMTHIEVPPLTPEYAAELASRLLEGEGVPCDDQAASAQYLATATDGIPYYIHHLVDGLAAQGASGNPDDIEDVLSARLTSLRDPWHLQYYDERIDTHYAEPLRPLARNLLDQLAVKDVSPHTFEELVDGVDPAKGPSDPDTVRNVLRLLGLDNYLSRDKDGAYHFSYPFIARVWRAIR